MNQATEEKVQTRVQGNLSRRVSESEISFLNAAIEMPNLPVEGVGSSSSAALVRPNPAFLGAGLSHDLLGSVPLPLSPDWPTEAPNLFFSEYIFSSDGPEMPGGHLEFLPELCREESQSQCLMEAIDAVSFANVATQSSLTWLTLRARKSYGKALISLNATLQNTEEAQKDSTLATVVLMSMYEVSFGNYVTTVNNFDILQQMISGEKPTDKVWDSHGGGREFLLRLRGLQQLQSNRGKSLFRIVYTQMVRAPGYFQRAMPERLANYFGE